MSDYNRYEVELLTSGGPSYKLDLIFQVVTHNISQQLRKHSKHGLI